MFRHDKTMPERDKTVAERDTTAGIKPASPAVPFIYASAPRSPSP
jgi:hypothetical protein